MLGYSDTWKNLSGEDITSGQLRIITEWLTLSTSHADFNKLKKESLERPEIATACLLVYVGHCSGLPGKQIQLAM